MNILVTKWLRCLQLSKLNQAREQEKLSVKLNKYKYNINKYLIVISTIQYKQYFHFIIHHL